MGSGRKVSRKKRKKIAGKLGGRVIQIGPDLFMDLVTNSTFTGKDVEEARQGLIRVRTGSARSIQLF